MKRFALILLLCCCAVASAQTTKVRGRVTDAETGESIPFAGIFFKGTTIGITTDMDGCYSIETRSPEAKVLVCQLLGYDVQEKEVNQGSFSTIDFSLKLTDNRLKGIVVKADNSKIKRLLANIDARRSVNDPEKRPSYTCDIYNKMELDLAHAEERLAKSRLLKDFRFIFNYMDTSAVNGVPYLPAMISETFVRRYHTSDPNADSETVIANRISGINPENNLLTQFTGSMHLKIDFYKPFINSFDVEFPSPIQNGGLLYYNYFIVDSLNIDGRKTYLVHYHPKEGISSPAFDGEMQIDAEDFALRSIHAKMKHGGNVNWLRDIIIDSEYQRLPDSTWFYKKDKMYADFSIVLRDSSRMMSVMGTRELTYSNLSFEPLKENISINKVVVNKDANQFGDEFWDSTRPYQLSEKEKGIYKMVDEIKDVPLYKTFYDVVYMLINGYWEKGPVGFGPYAQVISFNNLEGARVKLGMHTSKDFSKTHRLTGYVAYGFKDRGVKGGFTYECMLGKEPTRKLTFDAKYDMIQLGRSNIMFDEGDIISSALNKGNSQKLCPASSFSLTYEHEFNINVNARFDVAMKRYYGNSYVPMISTADGRDMKSIACNELHAAIRFSKEETVNRGYFEKTYLHTDHPVITLEMTGGIHGLRDGDYGYFSPEVSLDWKFRIPPAGQSKIHVNLGTIIGKVPYHMLHIHEGNGTYMLDKRGFSCMDYFEFASDTWASVFWNHNFNGFFFGKIPFLEKLKLREEFTFKAAYGMLSDKNNANLKDSDAIMVFPEGMQTLKGKPYMEIGAGISNILRLLRVDCFWRLTHRERSDHNFSVTLGLEFRF